MNYIVKKAVEKVKNRKTAPKAKKVEKNSDKNWQDFHVSGYLWGFLLVATGLGLLLGSLGLIDMDLSHLWKLWPVLLVAAGISFLPIRGKLAMIVASVFALFAIIATVLVTDKNSALWGLLGGNGLEQQVGKKFGVKSSKVNVELGSGGINLQSAKGGPLVKATLDSESQFELLKKESYADGVQSTELSFDRGDGLAAAVIDPDMNVQFRDDTPLSLSLKSGVGSVKGDLSSAKLDSLKIDSRLSKIDLKIGQNTKSVVDINSGAGLVLLRLPKGSAIKITTNNNLTNRLDIPETIQKTENGDYQTENFEAAEKSITVNTDLKLANLKIEEY